MPTSRPRSPQPHWAPETLAERSLRRAVLCDLDGLLERVEHWNLSGHSHEVVPLQLWLWYRRRGGHAGRHITGHELVEELFTLQETVLRPVIVSADALSGFPLLPGRVRIDAHWRRR